MCIRDSLLCVYPDCKIELWFILCLSCILTSKKWTHIIRSRQRWVCMIIETKPMYNSLIKIFNLRQSKATVISCINFLSLSMYLRYIIDMFLYIRVRTCWCSIFGRLQLTVRHYCAVRHCDKSTGKHTRAYSYCSLITRREVIVFSCINSKNLYFLLVIYMCIQMFLIDWLKYIH